MLEKSGQPVSREPQVNPASRPAALNAAKTPTAEPSEACGPVCQAIETVRIGMVGLGLRGECLLRLLVEHSGVRIHAVCDVDADRVDWARDLVETSGQQEPVAGHPGTAGFQALCDRDDLDLVVVATPWNWHVPVCVAALCAGHHVAVEVPAALRVDECWELVERAEAVGRHCVMLENCCYGRAEMMVWNMVRQGVLGELVHGEAGYLHDLRNDSELIGPGGTPRWRLNQMADRNGNLYPTHGLGPIAQYMDINRGDRFDYLVSMSSASRGLNAFYADEYGPTHPLATREYGLGDINTTLVRTINGRTIAIGHGTQSPRPYSRVNLIQGTRGIFQGYPDRIALQSHQGGHVWQALDDYRSQYEHPLWRRLADQAEGHGHDGMDFMLIHRLVHCLRTGAAPDMDVYDAAAWSVIGPLSEQSVSQRSRSVDVPDFTRGRWKSNPPREIDDG